MKALRHSPSIPLLDLSRFDAAQMNERAVFLAELRDAARQGEFFNKTSHGIEPALLDGLLHSACRFFALPEPDKLAVAMERSPDFQQNGPHLLVKLIRYPGRDWTACDQGIGAHKARVPERDPRNLLFRSVGENYLEGPPGLPP